MSKSPYLGGTRPEDVFFLTWHYANVIEVDDPYSAGRIKVVIPGIDTDVPYLGNLTERPVDKLPWCEPLLPKYINVVPKVGDTVKVTVFDLKNKKQRREYIGPVISQQRPPNFENPNILEAEKIQTNNDRVYYASWKKNVESSNGDWKIYPDLDDISFIGRSNTDFILRDKNKYNEVILRAGKINLGVEQEQTNSTGVLSYPVFPLNEKNPGYITINFSQPQNSVEGVSGENIRRLGLSQTRSHINVVADNLNLISHKGSSSKGKPPAILSGDKVSDQIRVESQLLHPLVYGDKFWEFLKVLQPYILNHIHIGSRREPDGDETKNNLIQWFESNMGTQISKPNPDGSEYVDFENCTFLSKGVKTN